MTSIENRLKTIQREIEFRAWLTLERQLSSLSEEELQRSHTDEFWLNPPTPPPGSTRFDSMDRASLLKLFKKDRQRFMGRNRLQVAFFTDHGHWPEQACRDDCQEFDSRFGKENV